MLAVLVMAVVAAASAWAHAEVFGITDPNVPLKIFPSGGSGVDSENIDLAAGTRVFFIESMPKSMTVRRVMLGRFARGSGCSVDPDVDLSIYSFSSGSDLASGRLLVRSTTPQPFGSELEFSTWLVDPTALTAGGTYAFEVKSGSEACRTARELSIAHDGGWQVDGGERSCAVLQDGSGAFRLWHRAEEEDAEACGALSGLSNFDPTMPTGWIEAMLEGERATIRTRECSLGASGSSWREGIVCEFGAFTAPGDTIEDGWFYGLPWTGPGLEGSPRDIYLELEPDLGPIATPFVYPVLRTSATLKAKINPGGSPTHYHFEWGTDTRYGNVTPEPEDAEAGDSRRDVTVSQSLTGLEPTTTYHYRVVAAHGEGPPVISHDRTFTTATSPASTVAPTISGTTVEGEQLTASTGAWSGTEPIEHTYQWRRCDAEGASCADIRGATRRSYLLVAADVGSTLRVVVSATNAVGEASATSNASGAIERAPPAEEREGTPQPPDNRVLPNVFGEAVEGETLRADEGTWSGDEPIEYTYQWRSCDARGESCSDIEGADRADYEIAEGDVGATLRVAVTATNTDDSVVAVSDPTAVVEAAYLRNTAAPTIAQGTTANGDTLTADPGTWAGAPPIGYAFRWQRCDADGQNCANIPHATRATYVLGAADIGATVRVVVIASNAGGSRTATSEPTDPIANDPPSNAGLPSFSGDAVVGGLLEADTGLWAGARPMDFTFQWRRCDERGASCSDIVGANDPFYAPVGEDAGTTVRVVVTASSAAGEDSATSAASPLLLAEHRLENTAPPSITGTLLVGELLTADEGLWTGTGTIEYAYQWQRCNAHRLGCVAINGADDSTYELTEADVDHTLAVVVTATDENERREATTFSGQVRTAGAPAIERPPVVSGTPAVGEDLTVTDGEWTGTGPIEYAYQWQSCEDADQCADIAGATSSTYTVGDGDIEQTIRAVVTATNASGSTAVVSAATATITPPTPYATEPPTITGTAREGAELVADHGAWTGRGTVGYTYQWQRCDDTGGECADIEGGTASSFRATEADVGSTLRVLVAATDEANTTRTPSAPTGVVVDAAAPLNTAAPTIEGRAEAGETLTANPGTWTGRGPIEYAYQWQTCADEGDECEDIDGATESTYRLTGTDVELKLRVVVTATNEAGSDSATSTDTAPVDGTPSSGALAEVSPPTISGAPYDGETLTAEPGEWTAHDAIEFAYQWRRCDTAGRNCSDIDEATGLEHTLEEADDGSTVRVSVTATSGAERHVIASDATAVVTERVPVSTSAPTITGDARVGELFVAEEGAWSNEPDSFEYTWQSCEAEGGLCIALENEEEDPSRYLIPFTQIGNTIRVVVTATNRAGSAEAAADPTAVVEYLAPTARYPPSVLNRAVSGEYLYAEEGSWTGEPESLEYTWETCDAEGEGCRALDNEREEEPRSYLVPAEQIGNTIRVVVTATNRAGSTEVTSDPTAAIRLEAPYSYEWWPPSTYGTPIQGYTLTAETGAWFLAEELTFSYQWRRCDETGAECADIEGATGSTYRSAAGDVGSTLRVAVTATNAAGETTRTSEPTEPIGPPDPPVNDEVGPPTISGYTSDGRTLQAEPGLWFGPEPIEYAYQWQRCDAEGARCADVEGATEAQYRLTSADLGSTLRVEVEASNPSGSARAQSAATALIARAAPSNDILPSLDAPFWVGAETTVETGAWAGSGPLSFGYQWQRCDAEGRSCADIEGATTATYAYVEADIGSTVRVSITATNTSGRSSAVTDPSAVVAARPIENVEAPSITGTPDVVSTLTADPGRWSVEPDDYSYQWSLCDEEGRSCEVLEWATEATFSPSTWALHRTFVVAVTAHVGSYTRTADSAPSDPITLPQTGIPAAWTSPRVEGTLERGETLTANEGEWSGAPPLTYTYQWLRCDPEFFSCFYIEGATRRTYTLGWSDVGYEMRVTVRARNAAGSPFFGTESPRTDIVVEPAPRRPVNTTTPSIEGDAITTAWQRAEAGTWTGEPSFDYQWQRCDAEGRSCTDIEDATGEYYRATEDDEGSTLRVVVTATNAAGSERATSEPTSTIRAVERPRLTEAVHVLGIPQVGEDLYAELDAWSGINITYEQIQFQRCDEDGERCVDVDENFGSHHVTREDIGSTFVVIVTASNDGGATTVRSVPTEPVPDPGRLSNIAVPTLNAFIPLQFERPYFLNRAGIWTGIPDLSYQWQRCDPLTEDPETHEMECVDIEGAPDSLGYGPVAEDIGFRLRLKETATTGTERLTVYSAPTRLQVADLEPIGRGSYTGRPIAGETITAHQDLVSAAGLRTTTEYRFFRADREGNFTIALQEGEEPSYMLTEADVGHRIRSWMTVSFWRLDDRVVVYRESPVIETPPIEPTLGNDAAPTIEGTAIAGNTLTADPGDWSGGAGDPTYAYQWRRCDREGAECADIRDATATTYTLTNDDIDATLRVTVTAEIDGASQRATSEETDVIAAAEAPANTEAPEISGEPRVLETLTASTGGFSGDGPLRYTYRWQLCDGTGTDCQDAEGTSSTFQVPSWTSGSTVRVRVTATNAAGQASATSAATEPLTGAGTPQLASAPRLTLLGAPEVGSTLMTDGGTWRAVEHSLLTYQWKRCDTAGEHCTDIATPREADGAFAEVQVPGAPAYDLTAADIGSRIRADITAHNEEGQEIASTELTPTITASSGSASGQLVFTESSGSGLSIANDDGSGSEQIAFCDAELLEVAECTYQHPRISPNGKMVLAVRTTRGGEGEEGISLASFASFGPFDEHSQIVLMNRDGSGLRTLETPADAHEPTWTPDGTGIVFATEDEEANGILAAVSADGSNSDSPVPVATAGRDPRSPVFSTDGEHLVYTAETATGDRTLYAMTFDEEEPSSSTRISDAIVDAHNPAISSDGQRVIFSAESGDGEGWGETPLRDLYAVNVDGSHLQQLTHVKHSYEWDREGGWDHAQPLPSGGFVSTHRRVVITEFLPGVSIDVRPPTLWAMAADGSGGHPLATEEADELSVGPRGGPSSHDQGIVPLSGGDTPHLPARRYARGCQAFTNTPERFIDPATGEWTIIWTPGVACNRGRETIILHSHLVWHYKGARRDGPSGIVKKICEEAGPVRRCREGGRLLQPPPLWVPCDDSAYVEGYIHTWGEARVRGYGMKRIRDDISPLFVFSVDHICG